MSMQRHPLALLPPVGGKQGWWKMATRQEDCCAPLARCRVVQRTVLQDQLHDGRHGERVLVARRNDKIPVGVKDGHCAAKPQHGADKEDL